MCHVWAADPSNELLCRSLYRSLKVMYSEQLAHMIYAAADVVLVPSMFEPCGLTQVTGRYSTAGILGVRYVCTVCVLPWVASCTAVVVVLVPSMLEPYIWPDAGRQVDGWALRHNCWGTVKSSYSALYIQCTDFLDVRAVQAHS